MAPGPEGGSLGGPSTPTGISVVGTGYVGLVTALAFCEHGHRVACVDVLPGRVEQVARGEAPFYEPGVQKALDRHIGSGALTATTDIGSAVAGSEVTFICVGTPSSRDGSYDLSQVASAAGDIGGALRGVDRPHTVVTKSTVTPGANRSVVVPALQEASGRRVPQELSLASNPEFLREGSALGDALSPDRVIVGLVEGDERARKLMGRLYSSFQAPIRFTSLEGAELVKLASNSLLAVKVAFANEVANLAASVGADGYEVMEGVGLDHRISGEFLRAGAGFGGSCFPKDLRALVAFSDQRGLPMLLPRAALDQNEVQPGRVVELTRRALGGDLAGRRIALLGLAFKPDTDDVRETRALPILAGLLESGARVVCHDPMAGDCFRRLAKEAGVEDPDVVTDLEEALRGADAALIQTEWAEYRDLSPSRLIELMGEGAVVIDARRALDPERMARAGVRYHGVGHPSAP